MLAKRFFRRFSKRFLQRGNPSFPLKNQNPIASAKIFPGLDDAEAGSFEQAGYLFLLCVPYLDGHPSGRFEICLSLSCDLPVSIEPVRAAIKGSRRIEFPDLALQGLKLFSRNIGRVCDNYMEAA